MEGRQRPRGNGPQAPLSLAQGVHQIVVEGDFKALVILSSRALAVPLPLTRPPPTVSCIATPKFERHHAESNQRASGLSVWPCRALAPQWVDGCNKAGELDIS